jgi:hypothetical protein
MIKKLGFDNRKGLISTPLGDFKKEGTSLKLAGGSTLKDTHRVYHPERNLGLAGFDYVEWSKLSTRHR